MGNHVMYNHGAWFLMVIMSSLRTAFCCLPSVKKQKHDFQFYFFHSKSRIIKQLPDSVFLDIQNNQGLGKGYQPQPSASSDNPYLYIDYSGYHKNLNQ